MMKFGYHLSHVRLTMCIDINKKRIVSHLQDYSDEDDTANDDANVAKAVADAANAQAGTGYDSLVGDAAGGVAGIACAASHSSPNIPATRATVAVSTANAVVPDGPDNKKGGARPNKKNGGSAPKKAKTTQ